MGTATQKEETVTCNSTFKNPRVLTREKQERIPLEEAARAEWLLCKVRSLIEAT